MMSFSSFLRNTFGNIRMLLILVATYAVLQVVILNILSPLDIERFLDHQNAMTADAFRTILQEWIDNGTIVYYQRHFYLDFFHPIPTSLMFVSWIAIALNYSGRSELYNIVLLLPLVPAACDLVENTLHVTFLLIPSLITDELVAVSGTATQAKFTLFKWSFRIGIVFFLWGAFLKRGAYLEKWRTRS